MKIDIDYIAKILDVFIKADTSHISIPDLESNGINLCHEEAPKKINEKFLFHIQLMVENGLVSNQDLYFNGLKSIGIIMGGGGGVNLTGVPIRLTQQGHDFAKALNNKDVLLKLKDELKDAPFKVIFDGSQKLLTHFLKKKLDSLLAENA